MPGEMPLCKNKKKENMLCQVCLVKYRKRTCFVKYAWGNAVFQKQAKREHALSSLSSMPGEVPFCKKQAEREHALSSIPDGMPVCKHMLKENMFVKWA